MINIVGDNQPDPNANIAVKGFAVVFIVGCQPPPATALDNCLNIRGGLGNAAVDGIPLKLILDPQSIETIGPPTPGQPLAILTFK